MLSVSLGVGFYTSEANNESGGGVLDIVSFGTGNVVIADQLLGVFVSTEHVRRLFLNTNARWERRHSTKHDRILSRNPNMQRNNAKP